MADMTTIKNDNPGAEEPGLQSNLGSRAMDYFKTIRGQMAIGFGAITLIMTAILTQTLTQTSDTRLADHAGRQRMLTQRMAKDLLLLRALDPVNDTEQYSSVLVGLRQEAEVFDRTLKAIRNGGSIPNDLKMSAFTTVKAAQTKEIAKHASKTAELWSSFKKDMEDLISSSEKASRGVSEIVRRNTRLLTLSDTLVQLIKKDSGSDPLVKMLDQAGRQRMLSQRIAKNVLALASLSHSGNNTQRQVIADDLEACVQTFDKTLLAFRDGGEVPVRVGGGEMIRTQAARSRQMVDTIAILDAEWANYKKTVEVTTQKLLQRSAATTSIAQANVPLLASSNAIVKAIVKKAEADATSSLWIQIISICVAIVVAVGATWYLGNLEKRMTGRIVLSLEESEQLKQAAETTSTTLQESILELLDVVADAADGDLSMRARVQEGALGNVADAINQMLESFEELIGDIKDTALQSTSVARKIEETASAAVKSADDQMAALVEANGGVNVMSKNVLAVSDRAQEASKTANRTKESALGGVESVNSAVAGMNNLSSNVQAGAKKIKNLGDRSMEINSIVNTITKISDRTNMLALNAAIEASRAGEHGRGFSVVADEVRRLAERTAAATQEVDALVKGIQHEANESVAAMDEQIRAVEAQASLIVQAGETLEQIQDESEAASLEIETISSSAIREAESVQQVLGVMQAVSGMAQNSQEKARDSLKSATELAEVSEKVLSSVSKFTVSS